jgi:hypothetical protein
MKNGLHFNPLFMKMALLLTCFMLVMFYNKSKGAELVKQVKSHQCDWVSR